MKQPKLIAYRVTDLSFVNHLESGTQLKLTNKYAYNVRYSPNSNCIGEFTVDVCDASHSEQFAIHAALSGVFQYDPEQPREETHVQTFEALFPYARALVTTITANAGIPPIILPAIDPTSQSIYRIDRNPK